MKNFILVFLIGGSSLLCAQNSAERENHFNLEKGIAIHGYDPVDYFSNQATKGDKKNSTNYLGVVYYFSSEINKNTFLKNPVRYEPQFGIFLSLGIVLGAIGSHFLVLGTEIKADSGGLFTLAILVFAACIILLFIHRSEVQGFIKKTIGK